jgi:hypothetical protein
VRSAESDELCGWLVLIIVRGAEFGHGARLALVVISAGTRLPRRRRGCNQETMSRPTPVPAVERLLRGATGWSLCESVAVVPGFGPVVMPWHWNRFSGFPEPTTKQTLDELEAVVALGNYRRFLATADEGRLVREVHRAGQHATWPAVGDDDVNAERSIAVLRPVAETVLDAAQTQWWTSPCRRDDQHLVDVRVVPDANYEPPGKGVREELSEGMATEAEREERLRADDSVGFPPPEHHGHMDWCPWSSPPTGWATTRSVPGHPPLPAMGLIWDWDSDGASHTQHWNVTFAADARIYEINGRADWCRLVERYPRDVTYTRRSAWWKPTHWEGRWLLPDWEAVAGDYDGVHLSVTGFLEAAQNMLTVAGGNTSLVVWEPDETYWLNDVVALDGGPVDWDEQTDWVDDWSKVVFGDDGSVTLDSPGLPKFH